MTWRWFSALIVCFLLALFLVIVGLMKGSNIMYAFALAVLSVGLGANSFVIALKMEQKLNEKMNNLDSAIAQIAAAREEIMIALKERPAAGKPVAEMIQAFYQMYVGNLVNKQGAEAKQERENNEKS